MNSISVVIIAFNEENNIADCIRSAKMISDDIIVVDSGSIDNTMQLAESLGATIFSIQWKGYGASKNFGATKAKHDWIFSLDADERITKELAASINQLKFDKPTTVHKFKRENYFFNKKIRFGSFGFDKVKRIYHRNYVKWNLVPVHEKLFGKSVQKKLIKGTLQHIGSKNLEEQRSKIIFYAQKGAEKYFAEGKKTNLFKKFASPLFNSIKSYIFQLGFLDGKEGFLIAKNIAYYSWLKYSCLHQLHSETKTIETTLAPSKMKAVS